jgi:hypothetical protein
MIIKTIFQALISEKITVGPGNKEKLEWIFLTFEAADDKFEAIASLPWIPLHPFSDATFWGSS